MPFLFVVVIGFGAALALTPLVRALAKKFGVVDVPGGRKKHHAPTPLMGGLAIFTALVIALGIAVAAGWLPGEHIKSKYLVGMLVATALLILGGVLDDKYNLKPGRQILWPALAALAVIASGIGVSVVTNPFGGVIHLDRYTFTAVWWQGVPYKLTLIADIFTFAWLLGMTYTTKLLDGLDGLVAGITAIGALVVAAVSLTRDVSQPDTAIIAFALAGAMLGFLVFNFHPARIFLGEGGSTLAGFLLGTLAIISGGKIATTLLVLGLPLFDAAFVILRRTFWERRSPAAGDRRHLHFMLLDLGFSHRQAVLFYYFIAALFGTSTLVLQGWEKLAALGMLLMILLALLAAWLTVTRKKERIGTNV